MEHVRSTAKEYIDGEVRHIKEVMEARFDGLNAKIDGAVSGLNAKIDGAVSGLNAKIDGLSLKMDAMLALYQPLMEGVRRLQADMVHIKDALDAREPMGFRRPEGD